MAIKLHNTLTKTKEVFTPLDVKNVRMYVCGPTVYDFAHIGNARPVVVFDVLANFLRQAYGEKNVTYVRNITDVDDKIINRAAETGEDISAITVKTEKAFHDDMAALGATPPDVEPRATEHIPEMIAIIKKLIENGNAYEAEGHVLFSVGSFAEYGALSGRNRDEMIAGARVEVAPYKKDPADFILWKPSTDDQPGWESPWGPNNGRGRPGWHLECSAMSEKHLGKTFDIHGGGQDLIFPHHENEIAQNCCAFDNKIMAQVWMHNGYLMSEGEKMSKSLGNFYTVHDLLDEFPGEAIRLALLKTHYRQPLDFRKENLREAKKELDEFYLALRNLPNDESNSDIVPDDVLNALGDDLNTPKALSVLFDLKTKLNTADSDTKPAIRNQLLASGKMLGLLGANPEEWLRGASSDGLSNDAIEEKINARIEARANKDFATSDAIRDELFESGIIIEDGADGTSWRRA